MADPVSIALLLAKASLKLKATIDLFSENQKSVFAITSQLISETDDLTNLRNAHAGDHTTELDRMLEDLLVEFEAISIECDALLPNSSKGPFKRTTRWVKTRYTASSVERKIAKLRERVRDAQHKFLVKNSALTALDINHMKRSTSRIRGDIEFLVQAAQSDSSEANKIFGVDRMTAEQRKAALHRTTLDLAVTTRDERLFLIQLKIRTLKAALDAGTPTLYSDSNMDMAQGYNPEPHDPFFEVHTDPSKAWSRQDALIETVALLDILQDAHTMETTPAIVWFIRANRLSESLRSLGLRKEALQLCMIAHEVVRNLADSNYSFYQIHYADSLSTVSDCRIDMGDREGALVAIQECVQIRRTLAATKGKLPDRGLATSLTKLSFRLGDVGKKKDALSSIQESVGIYRALAQIDPHTFNQDLAFSLSILSNNLSNMGRREDALAAIQESVELRRSLLRTNSDAFNPLLARSLNNLSIHLSDEGSREDSLAVGIYSELAKTNPAAFTPDLALSLTNLSVELSYTGKIEEALIVTQETVDIYRALAKLNPDAFNADLAMSLKNLALRLSDAGKGKEASVSAREAVDIFRTLAKSNPNAFDPELALSLTILSPLLSEAGETKDALAVIQESVDIHKQLFGRYPDYFRPRLAGAFEVLSDCLQSLGQIEEARIAEEEARLF